MNTMLTSLLVLANLCFVCLDVGPAEVGQPAPERRERCPHPGHLQAVQIGAVAGGPPAPGGPPGACSTQPPRCPSTASTALSTQELWTIPQALMLLCN